MDMLKKVADGAAAALPVLKHCGNGWEEIAGCVWLMIKYEEARQNAFRAGRATPSKGQFLAAPQYFVALTPLSFIALLQSRLPFANVAISGPQTRHSGWTPQARDLTLAE